LNPGPLEYKRRTSANHLAATFLCLFNMRVLWI